MAIDHESPFKEPRLKDRRITEGDGGEPEEEVEFHEDAVGSESEEEEERAVSAAHGVRGPQWLRLLLTARFYTTCEAHSHSRRGGERTMFCLDCAAAAGTGALCSLCAGHGHLGHRVIQIRRSSYNSVVRVSDIRGLVDMDGVQTYVINGARVVFLNERSPGHNHKHSRLKGSPYACVTCRRGLRDAFRFCSLGCKAAAGSCHDGSTYSYSFSCSPSPSPLCNAFDQSCTPPTPLLTMPLHRRKGIPHRAPFGNLVV